MPVAQLTSPTRDQSNVRWLLDRQFKFELYSPLPLSHTTQRAFTICACVRANVARHVAPQCQGQASPRKTQATRNRIFGPGKKSTKTSLLTSGRHLRAENPTRRSPTFSGLKSFGRRHLNRRLTSSNLQQIDTYDAWLDKFRSEIGLLWYGCYCCCCCCYCLHI